ncbi:MAG: DUF4465 domain-containing protein [Salinivirgaceae bacterium]|nr:DUF4465 domain-containing protein [Salinivirgaceae bacterium]MDD4748059.1 DUF4465 domain-containing protein [Salinivirgaceae bacterium]
MNKFLSITFGLLLLANVSQSQNSYLTAVGNNSANDIFTDYDMLSTFDIKDGVLYGNTGDTIICINIITGEELVKYGKPQGYNAYPSFVYANPTNNEIWAGFTVTGNSDDRIYRIDLETAEWHHKATLTGNFDMEIINNQLVVDGAIYGEENKIYLLDTTGNNSHRLIIETSGSSAGITADAQGNLYFATATFDDNYLVKWSSSAVLGILSNTDLPVLQMSDAVILSDLPAGAYDCDIDQKGNVIFSVNDYASDKILAIWNKTEGNGYNYDTLAYTSDDMDWLTMVKTMGDVLESGNNNGAFVLSYARPIAKINGTDQAPILTQPFENIQLSVGSETVELNLNNYFTDPDSEDNFTFSVVSNSNSEVVLAAITDHKLTINPIGSGQTTVTIEAENENRRVTASIIIGSYHAIVGEYTIANFENLDLENNSYWNGANGEGSFQSGNAIFTNHYNAEYGSWNQWAYSNSTNDTTPGWSNQYSAITKGGFESTSANSGVYTVSYVSDFDLPTVKFANNKAHTVKGFYTTNSTYTALSMKNGDAFSKKFGGVTGSDADWLKLSVWGFVDGKKTDTIEFYLADYRFGNQEEDYIVQTWQWVELSSLGAIDSLQIALSSSDNGAWGMNTPAYLCADQFYISPTEVNIETIASFNNIHVFPNPASNYININTNSEKEVQLTIFDISGSLVKQVNHVLDNQIIDIQHLPSGLYVLRLQSNNGSVTKRLIKQ